MKIGILTLPLKTNYGCLLQAYALQKVLIKRGHDAWIIRRRWNSETQGALHKCTKVIYHKLIIRKFNHFVKTYLLPQTKIVDTKYKVSELEKLSFDAYVVGSDQVWRMRYTRGVGYNFFLDFVNNDNIKKFAYAASFGVDYWDDIDPNESIPVVKKLLNQFDAIFVREKSGCKLCKDVFGINAELVLDPTLLLSADDYIRSFQLKRIDKKYLAVYILDMNAEKKRIVNEISSMLNLPVRYLNYASNNSSFPILDDIIKPSVEKWVQSIYNSQYVLTDSFHGTLFSIIFKRQFVTISNKKRGETRIHSILDILGLENRILNNDMKIIYYNINYDEVYLKLEEMRNLSFKCIDSFV